MIIILKHLEVYGNSIKTNYLLFNDNGAVTDFSDDDNNSILFKFKTKIAGKIGNDGRKNVKIRVPLKYLSNFS